MADTPDTPKPPAKSPTPTRRRAPRISAGSKPAKAPPAKPKPVATPEAATPSQGAPPPKRAPAPKPRSTTRAAAPKRHAPGPLVADTPPEPAKASGNWVKAAIVGGIAAIGVIATAALLSLRGSTPKAPDADPMPAKGAHSPDGTDASASFAAGIADENTVPDMV